MTYKHIIWDYNGTLLSDVDLCVNVINEMLSARNLKTISTDEYCNIFDFPVRDYYEKIGFDFMVEPFEEVGVEFINKYNLSLNEAVLQANAKEILCNLFVKDFTQYILSARNENDLIIETKFFEINKFFDEILGLDNNYAAGKTENGVKLINSIDADKSEIVLIGDTIHDCEVAEKAGIDFIAVAHGHHSFERLSACNIKVFHNLKEVEEFLMKSD